MLECYTFEYELLNHSMTKERFDKKIKEFIDNNIDDINSCLKDRNEKRLDNPEIVALSLQQKFEHIKKFGFTKKLLKSFRRTLGGSGFKRIEKLSKAELETYCGSLIEDLRLAFDIR